MSRAFGISRIYNVLVYIFLYAPILVLIIFSFNDSRNRAVWSGFTLHWYADLLQNDAIINAFIVTVAIKKKDEVHENLQSLERIWDDYGVYEKVDEKGIDTIG